MQQNIFIVGFMGSGKSTLAVALAKELGKTPIDLDNYIEQSYKKTIRQLFVEIGEEKFRKIENDALHSCYKTNKNFVLATGGGTPCYHNAMTDMLEQGIVVYLNCDIATIVKRLMQKEQTEKRPLLNTTTTNTSLDETVSELFEKRKSVYEMAHISIPVSENSNLEMILSQTLNKLQPWL